MQNISGTREGTWRQKLAADFSYKKTNKSLKAQPKHQVAKFLGDESFWVMILKAVPILTNQFFQ